MELRLADAGRMVLGLALLALAGCGEGDTNLGAADVARRGSVTSFSETFSKQVYQSLGVTDYTLRCLEGSRITAGAARIVAVTGNEVTARDYALQTRVVPAYNKVSAKVYPTARSLPKPPPFVTVELTVTCDNPPFG